MESMESIRKIAEHFQLEGLFQGATELTAGNINTTYRVTVRHEATGCTHSYILQRLNPVAFKDPEGLMENIRQVTAHLNRKWAQCGQDANRRVLHFLPCVDQDHEEGGARFLYRTPAGEVWRACRFIEGATAHERIESPKQFYEAGRGFGLFQAQLADFPVHRLCEPIPDFHHTPKRYEAFLRSVEKDVCGRVAQVRPEIEFLMAREELMRRIVDGLASGTLPLRVTHNDTKLNNVMLDNETGEALCVIDLDTVMPGSSLYDYGDAVRYGASTAAEDEEDTRLIGIDWPLFCAFTEGFVRAAQGDLAPEEIRQLPLGIRVMTCELAMRFLTDYLDGDVYFKTRREGHNLIRARAQLTLLHRWEERAADAEAFVRTLCS